MSDYRSNFCPQKNAFCPDNRPSRVHAMTFLATLLIHRTAVYILFRIKIITFQFSVSALAIAR